MIAEAAKFDEGTPQARVIAEIMLQAEALETELFEQVSSTVALVEKTLRHTLGAGGKRLRPAFVALSASAVSEGFDAHRARLLGACMEMVHMATLMHDDVIDNSAMRRGRETASSVYGNTAAILSGDVLLANAMAILARDGDLAIIRTVSEAVVEMAEGEVRELELRGQSHVTEEEHLEVLRMKTASFIRCCCEVGAIAAGGGPEQQKALGRYGHHAGMAFQIADDILDYRASAQQTGKPQATDYREGCATLPLIYLLAELGDEQRSEATSGFGNGVTDEEVARLVHLMGERGVFEKAEQVARRHASQAVEALQVLAPSPARDVLECVADFVVSRSA